MQPHCRVRSRSSVDYQTWGRWCKDHVKGFIEKADALKDEGVKKVMIMAVDEQLS